MTAQIITKREFWNAMVAKAVQKFEYGISTGDQLVASEISIGTHTGNPELTAVPGHVGMVPGKPGELRTVRT